MEIINEQLVLYYSDNEEYLNSQEIEYIEQNEVSIESPILVEDSGWISENKIDIREEVYHFKGDNTYYKLTQARSGDYFSGYDYYEPEVYEVVPHEVITYKYVKKI